MTVTNGYSLLDSGDGRKLERFGARTLVRPSSIAIWKPRASRSAWDRADAEFIPAKDWKFAHGNFSEWQCPIDGVEFELRLQKNGQVGIFPEHRSYLAELGKIVQRSKDSPAKVLNLFAYSGFATCWCAGHGAHVTHVDISKSALSWAERNLALNNAPKDKIRLICDDALKFIEREAARGNRYDLVIADPPSFSRVSKSKSWDIEEVIKPLVANSKKVSREKNGGIVLSCHHQPFSAEVLGNLLRDELQTDDVRVITRALGIPEAESPRVLPAGNVAIATW